MNEHEKKSRTTDTESRRQKTRIWNFGEQKVCKKFFLHTLGFKNDQVVKTALKSSNKNGSVVVGTIGDRRGQHEPSNKLSDAFRDQVIQHIEKYRPQVSHYRRDHAPNRRYLPSELSISEIYRTFSDELISRGEKTCSFPYFYKVFKQQNISFAVPENDLCTKCMKHKQAHPDDDTHDCSSCSCASCIGFPEHKQHAHQARKGLAKDTQRMECNQNDVIVTTVDMQKALCMPKLPIKDYYFSRKLVLFNETFATPGKVNTSATAVLWHEGEAGRKAFNITSSYLAFLRLHRDAQEVILYADNCSSQNKNWTLLSAMTQMVNDPTTGIQTITMKYLEPGHTFMAADSVHGSITTKLKQHSSLFDIEDYQTTIQASRKNMRTVVIDHSQMYRFENEAKKSTGVLLKNVKIAQFRRGSTAMFYKTTHVQENFVEIKFLKAVPERNLQQKIRRGSNTIDHAVMDGPRGIPRKKKDDLLKLAALMPRYKATFFENLIVNEGVHDLETTEDY